MHYSHTVQVPTCPLCNATHTYQYAPLMRITLGALRSAPPPPVRKRFTLALVCPAKNERFQVTVELEEAANAPIEGFEVGPVR